MVIIVKVGRSFQGIVQKCCDLFKNAFLEWKPNHDLHICRWKKQVDEEGVKVGMRMEDVLYRSMWCVGIDQIAAGLR